MIELFTDLPIIIKQELKRIIDISFDSLKPKVASELIEEFAKLRPEAEQQFINFYLCLKKEQLKNENNYD